MRERLPALALALAAVVICIGAKPVAEEKQSELAELKSRIGNLRTELGKAEETRGEAAEELKETEVAISKANRSLRELAEQKQLASADLTEFRRQASKLETSISAQQVQLTQLLHRHYVLGETDQLRHILSGTDPNQVARDLYYLRSLSRSQASMIAGLRKDLAEKRGLAERARTKSEEITAIETRQQAERAGLIDEQKKHRELLAKLADKIKLQRRQIETLKRNEQRLAKLIEGLGRIIARPETPRDKRPPAEHADTLPERMLPGMPFASLRGKLRLPARGEIATRYGAPRSEGGAASKGVFIRADEGGEVRAVAAGRVVFAEWLRGFGNLLIIDHGGDYLSVYGNNQSLFKSIGQEVAAGDAVASVGASGGSPESGLYFELRFQGQPIDPMKWVGSK